MYVRVSDGQEFMQISQEGAGLVERLSGAGQVLTSAPLAANATYTQTGVDRLNRLVPIGRVRGYAWADQAGALYLEESEDNATWSTTTSVSVGAGVTVPLSWTSVSKRHFRFRYVNGGVAQSNFILVQQVGGLGVSDIQLTGSSIELARRGRRSKVAERGGSIAASTQETVIDLPAVDCEIWGLEFASNTATTTYLHLYVYYADASTYEIKIAEYSGGALYAVNHDRMNTYKHDLFETLLYDEANLRFKVGLKKIIRASYGFKLVVENTDVTAKYIATQIRWAERW